LIAVNFKAYVADCRRPQGSLKRLMAAALPAVAATALLLSAASPASAGVGIDITIAPPAPRVVVAPPPRAGYVWAPGYWRWDGGRHVWVDGRWMRERRHFHWAPEHWDEGRHGHYHFVPGHWVHN
jgi:D-alanyl-D-alanine dipeptidase